MFTVSIDPVLVHLGPFALSWYGLAIAAGILVGGWLTTREAQRRALPAESVWDVMTWIVVGGLVGARLLFVLDRWPFFAANPSQILAVQNGGISIMGAILGGGLAGSSASLSSPPSSTSRSGLTTLCVAVYRHIELSE